MTKTKQLMGVMLLLSLACSGCGKQSRSLYEKAGGFSYDPPAGWAVTEMPGLKYQIARGPAANGFAPNINVVDEKFPGSLAAYVAENLKTMGKVLAGMKVLKRDDVTTTDGQAGIRLAIEDEQAGRRLRQTFYFFENGSRKYVVTCTTLADGGDALDATFEASLKTFRVH